MMWYVSACQICVALLASLQHLSDAAFVEFVSNSNVSNHHRYIRQTSSRCGGTQFPCASGQCVSEDLECDGKIDCEDASDESDGCKRILCNSPYLFQCTYGGCIKRSLTCDGNKDCRDNSDETLSRCQNVTPAVTTVTENLINTCGRNFKCDSGVCVSEYSICDGTAECNDASDESEALCKSLGCPKSTYTCAYGACVNRDARCNGKVECYDGSDEVACPTPVSPVVTPTKKPPVITPPVFVTPSPGACLLPEFPSDGKYDVPSIRDYRPGTYVDGYAGLRVTCNKGFIADNDGSLCIQGSWSPRPPKCYKACPLIRAANSTTLNCAVNGQEKSDCSRPYEGTTVTITCGAYYEGPGPQYSNDVHCSDGSWDFNVNNYCKPKCGSKRAYAVTNIISGTDTEIGNYPWQTGIYKRNKHICGGSILTPRVVISAAHCFTDLEIGTKFPENLFMVTAGKYYRSYNHPNDTFAQYSEVSHIEVPERYKGKINQFEGDLALLVLTTPFHLSDRVQPVCLDWTNTDEYKQLRIGSSGVVSGWGQTVEGSHESETLKELDIPYIPYQQCYDEVPSDFQPFIRHDKICGGYLKEGKSVCRGDSGGGLSFKNKEDNRYYIRGLVSLSPRHETNQCNSNEYSVFTLVSQYIPLLRRILHENP